MVCGPAGPNVIEFPTDCAGRVPHSCKSPDTTFAFETAQQWLDDAFERTLSACLGEARFEKQFTLQLKNGCPTQLSSSAPFSPEAAVCLHAKLDAVRWDCGLELSCSTFSAYPL